MKDRALANAASAVGNNQELTAGPKDPALLQNAWFLEKLAHFDRKRIPERVVAKGSGAYATPTITSPEITKYSKAKLSNLKDATMVWDFFSLMPESLHQIIILMSDEGISKSYRQWLWRHTFSLINKKEERFWVKLHFKTLQGIKNISSEETARIRHDMDSHQRDLFRAIKQKDYPKWRFCMQITPEKDARDYKFHPFDITTRAVKPLALAKRIKAFLCYNVRHRVGASTLGVEAGRPPSYQALMIPSIPYSFSYGEYVNKVWSHKDYPLMKVGILKLNKNPQNYFAKVKQSAFNPANIVPGVGYSPDYMLQGRLFTYKDTQRYHLGIKHSQLPVNAPRCPFATSFKDGLIQSHYAIERKPSSLPGGYKEVSHARENKLDLSKLEEEFSAYAYDFRELDSDYYTQAGDLFNLMSKEEQERTCQNIVDSMQGVPEQIVKRQLEHFNKANAHYGARVKELWQIKTDATLV
ncbi:catalase [Helicobacter suis]|uniref:catalase n=1 Tax=Helicobacter suis TaxID=104628 RepID=UPI001F075DBF|nr:catalase [Helicobacter suis]